MKIKRSDSCLAKLDRMNKTLSHQEPDDASPYNYYDLDWFVTLPNMDPEIQNFEILKEDECKKYNYPVIHHGCGNVNMIFDDFIELGIDAYNPLEVKAQMDAFELKKRFGNKIAYCGNSNIQVWETGDKELIKNDVLRTLRAGKGGGLIFQSDHSVSKGVSGKTYDYIVKLVREYGKYPLQLGTFDEEI